MNLHKARFETILSILASELFSFSSLLSENLNFAGSENSEPTSIMSIEIEKILAASPATTRGQPTQLSVDAKGERIAYAVSA